MQLHDGEMASLTRRQPWMSQDNLLGTLSGGPRDVKHLIDDAKESVEYRLDGVPPVDGDVPMQALSSQPSARTLKADG
jgi:hypothetical protein